LQERKSGINVLIKKFGEGDDKEFAIKELIHRAKESSGRIADLEGGSERIQELNAELDNIFKVLRAESLALSKLRKKTALTLAVKITDEIRQLAMPHGAIEIHVAQNEGLSISDFNQSGLDEVSLLFTSHEGATPGMISKVASGGELSRIMLAIEVVLASINPVQTYVFDEVDAGVGGKAAVEVGRRLRRLAEGSQVIVVTHLAQVAVWANNHLVVQKNESGSVSVSDVIAVEGSSRSVEIARMLSGQENSVTAREHAQELLEMVAQSVIS
jgi:DNA repair protein RecN (Recombination protein N)